MNKTMKTKFEREERREIKTLITAKEDISLTEKNYKAFPKRHSFSYRMAFYSMYRTGIYYVVYVIFELLPAIYLV